ncbi:hypothetical protein [Bradyrhizobium sp.]|uniref:hypothetical protein n=1 Tax=Bradyrhizobium sp. TaxID=376 RepID=UPI0025BFE319|nr:hypothetical protein [Bradyrhizobium sp.]
MADASRAAFSQVDAAPFAVRDDGLCHDRNSPYLSTDAQPPEGDRAALVVPQPFPRLARQTVLRGMPKILISIR